MSSEILVACITGGLSLLGVIITNYFNQRKISGDMEMRNAEFRKASELADARLEAKLEKSVAVTGEQIKVLTDEVRKHNGFAQKIPLLEEQIRVANHRIEDLERMGTR